MKYTKYISWVSAILLFVIALAAFWVSFDAIKKLAIDNGTPVHLAWLMPVIIDGGIIVFSMSVLRSELMGERTLSGWVLIVLFTSGSVAFNIAHSNMLAWGIALGVVPPLTLLFSFEKFMGQIKGDVQRGMIVDSLIKLKKQLAKTQKDVAQIESHHERIGATTEQLTEQHEAQKQRLQNEFKAFAEQLAEQKKSLKAEIAELESEHGKAQMSHIQRLILHYVRKQPNATYRDMAEFCNVSTSTITTNVRQLKEVVGLHKNGGGWEYNLMTMV